MFGLSLFEIVFVLVVAFLIFGPEEFPQKIKQVYALIMKFKDYIHQAQTGFSKMRTDFEDQIKPIGKEFESSLSAVTEGASFDADAQVVEEICFVEEDKHDSFETEAMDLMSFQIFPDEEAENFESEPCMDFQTQEAKKDD